MLFLRPLTKHSLLQFLRLFRLLDLLSDLLQNLCCITVATSGLSKLILNFLSLHSRLPLGFGIAVIFVVDYLCIAVGYYWLAQRSSPGHSGRAILQGLSNNTCTVAIVLLGIAVPGAILHSWRLSLEVTRYTLK